MKVTDTIRKTIIVESDSAESARLKARDGYGRALNFPKQETYTEIVDVYSKDPTDPKSSSVYKDLEESNQ